MASPTHVRRRSSQSTVYSHSSPTLYRSSSYQPPSRHHHHVPSTPSPPSGIPRIDEKNLDGRVVIDGLDRWSTGGDRAGNGWGVSVVRSSSEGDGLDFLSLTAKRRQALEARKGFLRQLVLCVSFCGLLLLALFADPHSVKSSIPAQISSLTDRITWKAQPVPPVIPVVPDNTTSLFSPIVSDVTPAPVIPDNSPAPVAPVSGPIVPETGDWSTDLHSALQSSCSSLSSTTKPYDGPSLGSTAFASFPRSGNTFLRSLVERATSFQTSSVYCDKKLQETFLGECERKNRKAERWFQKTHYPALKGRVSKVEDEKSMDWERAVVVVRNPIDTLFSYWSFEVLRKTHQATLENKHTLHLNVTLGATEETRQDVLALADRWNDFHDVWMATSIPKLTFRYEDLRSRPLPILLSLTSFILPTSLVPSLRKVACAMAPADPKLEAYHSETSSAPVLDTWDRWDPAVRTEVLQKVGKWWCAFGYDDLLRTKVGKTEAGVDCKLLRKEQLGQSRARYFEGKASVA